MHVAPATDLDQQPFITFDEIRMKAPFRQVACSSFIPILTFHMAALQFLAALRNVCLMVQNLSQMGFIIAASANVRVEIRVQSVLLVRCGLPLKTAWGLPRCL